MAKLYYYKWSTKTGDTKYAFATDDHYIVAEIETEPQENNLQYSFIPLREVEARRRRNLGGTPVQLSGNMNIAFKNKHRELIQRIFELTEHQNLGWVKHSRL